MALDYLRSWTGRATVTFTHAPEPVVLDISSPSSPSKTITLLELIESGTPPCQLNPLLFNGHLQTCWTSVKGSVDIPVYYKRRIFEASVAEYKGQFAVDFVVPPYEEADSDATLPPRTTYYTDAEFAALGRPAASAPKGHDEQATGAEALPDDDDRPMVLCLHGLTGGSYELYLRAALQPLVEQGWAACVVNSRGCASSKITTGFLYNARSTWDLRQTVAWARKTWPKRRLFGMGFSLGANVMVNYCAEEGEKCLLDAVVTFSNPWTLEVASKGLQNTFLGKNLYSQVMGANLKSVFNDHIDVLRENPRFNLERISKIKYIQDFDREVQAPCWGYPSENAYYRDAQCSDALTAVRIPLLAINAADDPIALNDAVPYGEFEHNPYTVLITSSMGGHLSWFETGGGRWFAKPASNFLNRMATEVRAVKKQDAKYVIKNGICLDQTTSQFIATRHKLLMTGVDIS